MPHKNSPSPPQLTVSAAVALSLAAHFACGSDTGLAKYVADDCTTTPAQITDARRTLRSQGLSRCADAATCDDAFVMTQLAGASGCEAVTLAGQAGTLTPGVATRTDGPTYLHLFLEASASMNAYLAQQTGLRDHLLDAIQRLRSPLEPGVDSLALYYIGQRSAPYAGEAMDFVATLRPGKLPNVGTSTSDIADLVEAAFAKTGPADAVALVSDFVFSPGRGVDASQYLSQQRIVIRDLVQRRLQADPEFSVALVAAESDFDGTYYDRNNKTYSFSGERPYYYLVAGPRQLVLDATARVQAATGGATAFFSPQTLDLAIAIEDPPANGQQGRFSVGDDTDAPTITRARASIGGPNDGYLLVTLLADLSGLAEAATAVERAEISGGFELVEVVPIRNPEPPYTHHITLRRRGTQYPGTVTMTLPRAGAGDLSARYLADDVGGPAAFGEKTFGLQQLVEGIEGAYDRYASQSAARLSFTVQ